MTAGDTHEVKTPRPAATVMLLRDTADGLAAFLLRRHRGMEFAGGTTVFPGGGVDDRDRNADIDWAGPPPAWWAERMRVDEDLALALVCAAVRETFEECGVLLAGPAEDQVVVDPSVYRDARADLASNTLALGDFLRGERLMLRADLLRPWANWVTPTAERTRRYDTFFFTAALPEGQIADGQTSEAVDAAWVLPRDAIEDFAEGRRFLLPPTWVQLDSLAAPSLTVADILATEREIVTVMPELTEGGGNWSVDFFDGDRYAALMRRRPR